MATKKVGGSSKNGRDSNPKDMGWKKYGGESINSGTIIVRQKGTKFFPGNNVGMGVDFTLYAEKSGIVSITKGFRRRSFVNVI